VVDVVKLCCGKASNWAKSNAKPSGEFATVIEPVTVSTTSPIGGANVSAKATVAAMEGLKRQVIRKTTVLKKRIISNVLEKF
jgi:hypothetical protein